MVLKENITFYDDLLQEFVDYVNNGWKKNYTIQDVVGIELGKKFLFVHFNKKAYLCPHETHWFTLGHTFLLG